MIRAFMCPQKKKFTGLRSGRQGGQVTDPSRPIHLVEYKAFKNLRTLVENYGGARSSINPVSLWTGSGTACNKLVCRQAENDLKGDDLC